MKPDWSDAPEWANFWVHCPYDCSLIWFEVEPIYCDDCQDWHNPFGEEGRYEYCEPMSGREAPWGVVARND